jgi:hypothetical protein
MKRYLNSKLKLEREKEKQKREKRHISHQPPEKTEGHKKRCFQPPTPSAIYTCVLFVYNICGNG